MKTSGARLLQLVCFGVALGHGGFASAGPSASESELADSGESSLSSLLLALGEAQQLANESPELGIPELERVLAAMHDHPVALASDEAAQDARLNGLLMLARAKLNTGDDSGAADTLDEALRCAHGAQLDAASLGPSLSELEAGRRSALAQPGVLQVRCTIACRIYIDERESEAESSLPRGRYRVHITATHDDADTLDTIVEIAPDSGVIEVVYGPPDMTSEGPARKEKADPNADSPQLSAHTKKRLLPRWVEVSGVVLGALSIGAGTALLVIDGKCQDGGSPTGSNACIDLYSTKIAGFSAIGGGAAFLLGSSLLLGIDELRVRNGLLTSINLNATIIF